MFVGLTTAAGLPLALDVLDEGAQRHDGIGYLSASNVYTDLSGGQRSLVVCPA